MNAYGISGTNAHIVVEGYGAAGDEADGHGLAWRPVGSLQLVAADGQEAESPSDSSGKRLLLARMRRTDSSMA